MKINDRHDVPHGISSLKRKEESFQNSSKKKNSSPSAQKKDTTTDEELDQEKVSESERMQNDQKICAQLNQYAYFKDRGLLFTSLNNNIYLEHLKLGRIKEVDRISCNRMLRELSDGGKKTEMGRLLNLSG